MNKNDDFIKDIIKITSNLKWTIKEIRQYKGSGRGWTNTKSDLIDILTRLIDKLNVPIFLYDLYNDLYKVNRNINPFDINNLRYLKTAPILNVIVKESINELNKIITEIQQKNITFDKKYTYDIITRLNNYLLVDKNEYKSLLKEYKYKYKINIETFFNELSYDDKQKSINYVKSLQEGGKKQMIKIGDKIKIIEMKGEQQYRGKVGVVEHIDDIGQLHGSWGGCAIIPNEDKFEKLIGIDITKTKNEDNLTR